MNKFFSWLKHGIVAALLLLGVSGFAQIPQQVVTVNIVPSREALPAGQSTPLAVEIRIAPGWHINSHQPEEELLVPTTLELESRAGVTFGQLQFPRPEVKKFLFSEQPLAVYEGQFHVFTTVAIPPDFPEKEVPITARVRYQACNDSICLPPAEAQSTAVLPVAAGNEMPRTLHEDIFRQQGPGGGGSSGQTLEQSDLARTIESRGMLVAFVVIFISGLALNLTPCVYPLVPITISYFAGQVGERRGSLLMYALLYVLGMAITYSALGVLAALTGAMLGGWLQNPYVLLFIALVMVALALSMFGLFEIRIPPALANFAGQSKGGYLGALFMGLTVGIIAAPCIGPFVLALLTYVGEKGDPVLGFWMFFVLSLGLGLPYLFLALFSGAVNRLPRSGAWMVWVKKIFGFVLLALAIYFLNPLLPGDLWYFSLLAVTFLVGGIYLAWLDASAAPGKTFPVVRNLVGVLFLLVSVFFWTSSVEAYVEEKLAHLQQSNQAVPQGIAWQPYQQKWLDVARQENKPVFIDFFADWCIPCKELDKFTFSDERVIELSRRFIMLKADLTHFGSEEVQSLREQYDIRGVPTLVMLAPDGREIPGTRIVGFVKAEVLLQKMQQALQAVSPNQAEVP